MTTDQPDCEDACLKALRDLDTLDTPSEPAFERITRLVRDIFDAPREKIGESVRASESAPGSGSTFWVQLPLSDPPAEPMTENTEVQVDRALSSGPMVLYIEDTLLSIHLIRGILKRRTVQKVRLISAMQGDLGIEMARDPCTSSIPVVVLQADALRGTATQVLDTGAVACLSKPIEVKQFLETIDCILEGTNQCQPSLC